MPNTKVEIAFDSGFSTPAASRTWTDVSQWVEGNEEIAIGFARSDERSVADANTCSLTLDNSDGRFTAKRTASPYYPNVRVGRPIRVTSTTTGNLLTPNAASMETSIVDWYSGGSVNPTRTWSNTRAWVGTRSLLATWGTGGSLPLVGSDVTGMTVGETYSVSVYVWVPTGSPNALLAVGGIGVGAATSLKDQWVRLAYTFTATSTVHGAQVWPATAPTAGQQVWVDAAMISVGAEAREFTTVQPTTFTDIIAYIDEWPLEWEDTDAYAKTRVTASSRMSRLGSNNTTLKSVVEQEIMLDRPAVYYTLGEPVGSLKANDSSGNNADALYMTGNGTNVAFGSGTGPGTDGLTAATFAGGRHLVRGGYLDILKPSITVAIVTSTVSTNVFGLNMTSPAPGALPLWLRVSITAAGKVRVERDCLIGAWNTTGVTTVTDGLLHTISVVTNATTTTLYVDGVSDASTANTFTTDATGIRLGNSFNLNEDLGTTFTGTIAHVAIFNTELTAARALAHATACSTGFAGELPGAGIGRVAAYAALPAAEVDTEAGTTPLSLIDPTGKSVIEMMRIIESTESGVLYDETNNHLTFHGRAHRYLAAVGLTLDMDLQQIEIGYSPRLDRSSIINDITATTADGTVTVHVVNQASVDDYGTYSGGDVELATTDEEAPAQAAAWRVNAYGEPSVRVPSLEVNVAVLDSATQVAILAATVGTRMQVTNHPDQASASTADYFVEGYTKSISSTTYLISFNNSPADVYVGTLILDDATRGLLDTNTLAY